jgi:hypothetical protein
LYRILRVILEANPRFGQVYLCKIDIADGLYRLWLLPVDIPKLGVILPTEDGAETLIGFPLRLPMRWVNSPPYFTAATETICDLTNAGIRNKTVFLPHALDAILEIPIPPEVARPPKVATPLYYTALPEASNVPVAEKAQRPVAKHNVYVDYFVSMIQGNSKRWRQVKGSLFELFDSVFKSLYSSDNVHRQDPASAKKM